MFSFVSVWRHLSEVTPYRKSSGAVADPGLADLPPLGATIFFWPHKLQAIDMRDHLNKPCNRASRVLIMN